MKLTKEFIAYSEVVETEVKRQLPSPIISLNPVWDCFEQGKPVEEAVKQCIEDTKKLLGES